MDAPGDEREEAKELWWQIDKERLARLKQQRAAPKADDQKPSPAKAAPPRPKKPIVSPAASDEPIQDFVASSSAPARKMKPPKKTPPPPKPKAPTAHPSVPDVSIDDLLSEEEAPVVPPSKPDKKERKESVSLPPARPGARAPAEPQESPAEDPLADELFGDAPAPTKETYDVLDFPLAAPEATQQKKEKQSAPAPASSPVDQESETESEERGNAVQASAAPASPFAILGAILIGFIVIQVAQCFYGVLEKTGLMALKPFEAFRERQLEDLVVLGPRGTWDAAAAWVSANRATVEIFAACAVFLIAAFSLLTLLRVWENRYYARQANGKAPGLFGMLFFFHAFLGLVGLYEFGALSLSSQGIETAGVLLVVLLFAMGIWKGLFALTGRGASAAPGLGKAAATDIFFAALVFVVFFISFSPSFVSRYVSFFSAALLVFAVSQLVQVFWMSRAAAGVKEEPAETA